MSSNSVFFGYPIEHKDGVGWVFSDTLEPTITTHMHRPCGYCGLLRGEDDHDPCINTLPNTLNACCGHGVTECCYIMLDDGKCFYGEDARVIITNLKGDEGGDGK